MNRLPVWALLVGSFCLLPLSSGLGASLTPLHFDAHLSSQYYDDLPGLLKKRHIRVLTTVNRTNFFIAKGRLVGYEYELLKSYENYLNKKINDKQLKVVLEFIPVSREKLLPRLINGYGDIAAAGLTITPERQGKGAFTAPYLTGIDEIVVTRKDQFHFEDVFDLAGRSVFVRESSSYYQSLVNLNYQLHQQGKEQVRIEKAPEDLETESILELVDCGGVEITIADSHIARAWSRVYNNLELHEDIVLRQDSEIAWIVRQDNPKLLASLNDFLQSHKIGTLHGNMYFKRYYENTKRLKPPGKGSHWKKLRRYQGLMQHYAQEYGFDWRLILAMAMQESGLNHNEKSPAGAVGLMQVLPSTARDQRIDIPDISQPKNNIHAAVKYLALLRDEYFQEPGIAPQDRIRLSLAAYNAGPSKIQEARALAEKMGLDPQRWFRHVELAVLRLVGRETVRFVNNINKYTILYRTILELDP